MVLGMQGCEPNKNFIRIVDSHPCRSVNNISTAHADDESGQRGRFLLGGSWCPDLNNSPVGASDTWFNSTNPPLFSPLGRNPKGVFVFLNHENHS